MTRILTLTIFLLSLTGLMGGELTIIVKAIDISQKGNMLLAVFPGEEAYMDTDKIIHHGQEKVLGEEQVFVLKDLPNGEYTLSFLHDANGNMEMDMGVLMPKEGFAFSGKKQPAGKPPKYKDAVIYLGDEDQEITVIMKYY